MRGINVCDINDVSAEAGVIASAILQPELIFYSEQICFAWAEGAVCKDIVDVFYPISIVEKEQILVICQQEKIDGICTIASDVAAPTVAYVAEKMGLVGNSYEASLKANNKHLMRRAFMDAGVPCPQYMCVDADHTQDTLYCRSH